MRELAFIVATLVLVPYAVLAAAFVLLSRAISGGSLLSFLATLVLQAYWLIPWGVLGGAAAVIALVILGMNPRTRRVGAVILSVLALASVGSIWIVGASHIGLAELTFLSPCFAVAAYGAWSAHVRTGPRETARTP